MIYIALFFAEITLLFFLSKKIQNQFSSFFYRVTKSKKFTVYLMSLLFLPGTFIHEMAHYLTALFLLVPVGDLRLIPEFEEGRVRMGSVSIGKTDPLRRFIIGVAPFLLGMGIIFLSLYFLTSGGFFDDWRDTLLIGLVSFEVGNTMFASKKDLEGALELFLFVAFVFILIYLLGVGQIISLPSVSFTEVFRLFRQATFYLLVPLGVDALAMAILISLD